LLNVTGGFSNNTSHNQHKHNPMTPKQLMDGGSGDSQLPRGFDLSNSYNVPNAGLSKSIKIQGTVNGQDIRASGTDGTSGGDMPLMGGSSTRNHG